VRDYAQALTGLNINTRMTAGVLVATTSTSFIATDPVGLWKQAASVNIPLAAGTDIFEVDLPNSANFDRARTMFKPAVALTKRSVPYLDLQNGTTDPKQVPGGIFANTPSSPTSAARVMAGRTLRRAARG